jgi:xyloglucan-specific exo-beta-1,4-glucanase
VYLSGNKKINISKVKSIIMKKLLILVKVIIGLFISFYAFTQTDESSQYLWKKVVIGGGGYVTGVIFSEAQPDLIYSRTDVGGAYRWDQASLSWVQLLDFVSRDSAGMRCVESIAADPTDSGRVYIAAGGSLSDAVGGIYWSTDQGKTLTYVNTTFKMAGNNAGRGIGERLMVDPNSPNILFFASRNKGLFKSADYAKTWTKTTLPVTTTTDGVGLCFVTFDRNSSAFGNPTNDIYVGVSRKGDNLYKSNDAGETWNVVAGTPSTLQPHGAAFDTSGIMYFTYGSGSGPGVDGTGAVWKYNTKTLVWKNITPSGSWGGFGGISTDKEKPDILMVATAVNWGGGAKIYRSTNGGTTWKTVSDSWSQQPLDAPYMGTGTGNWIESMKIDPFNSDRVMYCTGAGIWAGNDVTKNDLSQTTHWITAVKGIEEAGAYHITSAPAGAVLFTQFGDINGFRHEDLTISPPEGFLSPGWGYGHCVDFAQNNVNLMVRVYASSPFGYISDDNGITWKRFPKAIPNAGTNLEKIHISANGTNIVWAPERQRPYFSKDKGTNWSPCLGLPSGYYNSMSSDRVNDNKFYYYDKTSGYLYISVDGGVNFVKSGYIAKYGQRLTVNHKTEGDLWEPVWGQGSGNGLYHSVNSGESFSKISGIQEATTVSLGREAPGNDYPTIYIYGKINNKWGVFQSDDTASTWKKINDYQHQYGWIDYAVADQRMYGRVFLSPNCMGVPYSELKYDCNGDSAGTASYDWCGECVGGNTGKVSHCIDCKGDTNGIAFYDKCGTCVGGNTGLYPCTYDCNGDSAGTAYFDWCGTCVGGNTGKTACVQDCNKVWGGMAYIDSCSICVGGNTGKTECTVSLSETLSDHIKLYPNPSNSEFILNSNKSVQYKITDISGTIIESGICEMDCKIGATITYGIYFLTISNSSGNKTIKIVKIQ